mgnify:CR=1 FL=1
MSKHEAIRETHNTVVTIRGNDQSDIVAFDNSGNSVTIDWTKVNNHISSNEYKTKRAAEYPSIVDQLDDIYHNGVDGWKTTIKAIKDKYPKE